MRAEPLYHKPSFRGGSLHSWCFICTRPLDPHVSILKPPCQSLSMAADCPRGSTESESDRQQSVLCQTEDKSSLESLLHLAMTWELASGFYTLKHPARAGSTADPCSPAVPRTQNSVMLNKHWWRPGVVPYIYNISSREAEAGGSLPVQGPAWVSFKILSQSIRSFRLCRNGRDFNHPISLSLSHLESLCDSTSCASGSGL